MAANENSFLGSGWSFPVTFSSGNYRVNLSRLEENVNDSIDIILQTKVGERNLNAQFGSGLQEFFFRRMDESLKGEIKDAVSNALLHNEPRITLTDVEVVFADKSNGRVEILVKYRYNTTNTRHNYVFPFYLNEGTNLS